MLRVAFIFGTKQMKKIKMNEWSKNFIMTLITHPPPFHPN